MDLFEFKSNTHQEGTVAPLAERLRPKSFDSFVGQKSIAGKDSPIYASLNGQGLLPNLILWGPPGSGKTSFANLISNQVDAEFVNINAVETGAKKLREIGQAAHQRKIQLGRATILFVDEIHRLNKSQQDVLLPFAEKGDFSLVGATTENPSYELNSALLSRCQLLVFEPLVEDDLLVLYRKALDLEGIPEKELLTQESVEHLIQLSYGDARRMLNDLEAVIQSFKAQNSNPTSTHWNWPLLPEDLQKILSKTAINYDRVGDEHYNCISAFIKSVRGSNADAAIYYLARMLEGGEDPVFIARRLVILASEDIGNADPRAITIATSGLQAVELIGLPEARISLAQVTTYLASAPKSNSSYKAINKAMEYVKKTGPLPIPKALRSARTRLMKQLGHGKDYKYSHDSYKGYIEQDFMPEKAKDQKFYEPSNHGFEKTIREYLDWLKN